jgi:DNA helicase II / ATP-dependent DNA helicase PcrA
MKLLSNQPSVKAGISMEVSAFSIFCPVRGVPVKGDRDMTTTPINALNPMAIAQMLNELNEAQREAAKTIYGPVLIIAGAGSGKTKSLVTRIANMMGQGIQSKNIFCATFTNKAAREMKERLASVVGEEPMKDIWMGTFHSLCVRILRKHGHLLGYEQDETSKRCKFVIYDTGDSLQVIERIYKQMNIGDKFKEGLALHFIDNAKNNLWDAEYCAYNCSDNATEQTMAEVYMRFQDQLKMQNAMDFGDLIMNTVLLLRDHAEARDYWQEKFHFVMSDEFQDANYAQFQLLLLLAAPHYNLFTVGDDYQAIYGFRGSDISIILNFKKYFPNATVIKLQQNYRSKGNIVHAGNHIMSFNKNQMEKNLITAKDAGERIQVVGMATEYQEAAFIAATIKKKVIQDGYSYSDFAILYRGNAQSRIVEDFFRTQMIPYSVVGGTGFYDREEIKDTLAYLRAIFNRKDDTALLRIINKPKRDIGDTTQKRIEEYATNHKVSVYRALKNAEEIPTMKPRAASKVKVFFDLLNHFQKKLEEDKMMLSQFVKYAMEQSGLMKHYQGHAKADEKVDNLKEFLNLVDQYEMEYPEKTLEDFLQEMSLLSNGPEGEKIDAVRLMTMHGSKGLEFPVVFLNGWNEGVFPSWRSQGDKDLEEERRLAYVGITRAEKELFITYAEQRTQQDGKTKTHKPSRFLEELPSEIVNAIQLSL